MSTLEERAGAPKRIERAGRWVLLLLSCSACSAPYACDGAGSGVGESALGSNEVSGSRVFALQGEDLVLDFRASLQGLPRLWPSDSAVREGQLSITLDLHYEREPKGSDGKTQMPRIQVTFTPVPYDYDSGYGNSTWSYPTGPTSFGTHALRTCLSDEASKDCCPFGAVACELPTRVELKRLDGAPFPPLVVDWAARATTVVDSCGFEAVAPTLSLKVDDQ